jgi:hypothetical protein
MWTWPDKDRAAKFHFIVDGLSLCRKATNGTPVVEPGLKDRCKICEKRRLNDRQSKRPDSDPRQRLS